MVAEYPYLPQSQQPQQPQELPQQNIWSPKPSIDIKPGNKAYRPVGRAMNDMFYFKGDMLILGGPAGTGKSRSILEKIHLVLEKYEGSRCLIFRKTRESLSESALFTYETHVLPTGHPVLEQGGQRRTRQHYQYPNGSELHIVGLDKPQKVMSTEFDIAYGQELVECDISDVEMVSSRLRNGVVPYQQMICDCNPDKPQHWIKVSADRGVFPLLETYHEDNPVLWEEAPKGVHICEDWPHMAYDGRIGRWTQRGLAYIAKLEKLTGARYQRLRLGKWSGAEGAVYEGWDDELHVLRASKGWTRLPQSWRRIWVVDFGFTHPFVWTQWAIDNDGRMYLELEMYVTKTLVETAARKIMERVGYKYDPDKDDEPSPMPGAFPWPSALICDWDAEGRATLEKYTGMRSEPAYKGITGGIQGVATRLAAAGDNIPRLFILENSLYEADGPGEDEELREALKPTCTKAEFPGYVWDEKKNLKKGEIPLDKDNHGMDVVRYAVCYEDGIKEEPKADEIPLGSDASWMPVGVPYKQVERGFGGVLIGGRH